MPSLQLKKNTPSLPPYSMLVKIQQIPTSKLLWKRKILQRHQGYAFHIIPNRVRSNQLVNPHNKILPQKQIRKRLFFYPFQMCMNRRPLKFWQDKKMNTSVPPKMRCAKEYADVCTYWSKCQTIFNICQDQLWVLAPTTHSLLFIGGYPQVL